MSLPDEVIEQARATYIQTARDFERYKWLTDQRGLDQLRDYLRGKRKTLNAEMKARLSEFAASKGLRPEDPDLERLAVQHVADWNEGEWGAWFELADDRTDANTLARRYLQETGTHEGQQRVTRLRLISTWALDAAALVLRPYCPFPWHTSTYDDVHGSAAQRWLLEQLSKIEPRIDEPVVRAIIERTSPA